MLTQQHSARAGRFYPLLDSNTIALYTLLPSGCSLLDLTAALNRNSPAARLAAALAAAAAARAAKQAAMSARLDAVGPLLAALLAEPPSSLSVDGVDPTTRLLWLGGRYALCYAVRGSESPDPKSLTLYVGDGSSGSYYANVLRLGPAGNAAVPAGPRGCVNITVSRGVPAGPYTLALEDAAGRAFATASFFGQKATVAVASATLTSGYITVGVSWAFPPGLAAAGDTVWVLDSRGALRAWFYTSCKCTAGPGPSAAQSGAHAIRLYKPAAPGGYTFELHPRGARAGGIPATNWIPWAKMGW
jgi:hypothetical protein